MVTYRDPVCDMEIEPGSAAARRDYKGKTYYFCSTGCARKFDTDAARYAQNTLFENDTGQRIDTEHHCCHGAHHQSHGTESAEATVTAAKPYYCPMCPGVESDMPGDCPKCGMRLERNPAYRRPTG
ncbi:MAG TPA: YHS domain-containing protein, partial [Chthoniobacterales bacterium]|nr:YHS domain-containing protein [Chthoniobacterales bacterium]